MLAKQVYELGKGWCGAVILIHFIPQFKHSYKHQMKNIAFKSKKPVNIALCFASQVWLLIAKADALKSTKICQVCQKASRPLSAVFTATIWIRPFL